MSGCEAFNTLSSFIVAVAGLATATALAAWLWTVAIHRAVIAMRAGHIFARTVNQWARERQDAKRRGKS